MRLSLKPSSRMVILVDMNLGNSIRSGTKWLFAGNLGGQLLQFAFGVALARLLVPADFGLLVTVQIFTGFAGFIAGGGTGQALVQAREVEKRDYQVVFTIQLLIGFLIYGFFFIAAPWFADWFGQPLYVDLFRVSAISFLLRPFVNVPGALLQRAMRFKASAIVATATSVISGMVSIILASYGWGVWSLVLGGLLGSLLSAVLLLRVAAWVPRFSMDREIASRLGSYGFKVSLNSIVEYVRSQIPNLVATRLMGTVAVGLYNKAASLNVMPMSIIGSSPYQAVFRALAQTQDNLDQSKYIYLRTMTLVVVYTLPFNVGLAWLAEPFISVVYGDKWLGVVQPLQILAISVLFRCVTNPAGAVLEARNLLTQELRIQLETLALLAIGCLLGYRWGISGIAWASVAGSVYACLRTASVANSRLGVSHIELLRALKPGLILNGLLFASLLLADSFWPADLAKADSAYYLFIMSGIGGLVYTASFLYLPMRETEAEAARWKLWLGLTRA